MDESPRFVGGNRKLRTIWEEAGSHDLRLAFHGEEQTTYFPPGREPVYQLDHVFADGVTKLQAVEWRVDREPVEGEEPLSDHAPIVLELKPEP